MKERRAREPKKTIIVLQSVWTVIVVMLVVWWGSLLLDQNEEISSLKLEAGESKEAVLDERFRTRRMLLWEGGTFLSLVIGVSGLLFWFYWRDVRRSKSLNSFFASVTHELKTPLTSIRLQAEALSGANEGSQVSKRLIEDTLRLENEVERTLELARLEGGGSLVLQDTDIERVVQSEVKRWNETQVEPKDIQMNTISSKVTADPTAIKIILGNLLRNSVKHAGTDRLRIQVEMQEQDGHIAVDYSDNGQGFYGDIKTIGKIFEKGEQSSGAGVGLYLVKRLMELMGGQVTFHGEKGFRTSLLFKKAGNA